MSSKSSNTPRTLGKSRGPSPGVKNYLIAYNTLSALGWTYIFVVTALHLSGYTESSGSAPHETASSYVSKFATWVPYFKKTAPIAAQIQTHIPRALVPLYNRARTLYGAVGPQTTWVQTFAVLEVVHSLLGFVRSPVQTTAMQVASRLYLVWVVAEHYESARSNALFATLLLAWSPTEIIRYSFYALSLVGIEPYPLLWLRYTTFYVLYPLGAGSEAFLNYSTLPGTSPITRRWIGKNWSLADYTRGALFLIWWPGLYIMYTYMIKQRKKVLGTGKNKAKST
ncbi:PTPLA-domain-containing protein [Sistotremastrum niveocremeum HHB9708]|uniref:Very-long-chain (3R)-3-hydroxyacyl-CoA dehydratase n=2 Tax=Sistotremastraceae TaxID=3402574 RepID=A0A164ZZI3_9AGAM|nr:PTPLA-domain-containing protein [Sistotremastrum niveocremeum HHB9708]KZT41433.1 PTPLA-domain-containing protein [Sistotremastrum suecicum HHB10207 ss-3]